MVFQIYVWLGSTLYGAFSGYFKRKFYRVLSFANFAQLLTDC